MKRKDNEKAHIYGNVRNAVVSEVPTRHIRSISTTKQA